MASTNPQIPPNNTNAATIQQSNVGTQTGPQLPFDGSADAFLSREGCMVYFQEVTDVFLQNGNITLTIGNTDARPILLAFRQSISDASQYVFIKLLLDGEWTWHRTNTLSDRFLENVAPTVIELSRSRHQLGRFASFCDGSAHMTLKERLDCLTLEELHEIAAKFGPKVPQNKSQAQVRKAVENAMDQSRLSFAPKDISIKEEIEEMAKTMLAGQCLRLNPVMHALFWGMQMAFVKRRLQLPAPGTFTDAFIEKINTYGKIARRSVVYRKELREKRIKKARRKYQAFVLLRGLSVGPRIQSGSTRDTVTTTEMR